MLSFDLNLVAFVLFESLTLNLVFSSVHRLISPFNTKSRLLYFHIKIKIVPNWKEKCFWKSLKWSIIESHWLLESNKLLTEVGKLIYGPNNFFGTVCFEILQTSKYAIFRLKLNFHQHFLVQPSRRKLKIVFGNPYYRKSIWTFRKKSKIFHMNPKITKASIWASDRTDCNLYRKGVETSNDDCQTIYKIIIYSSTN